MQTINKQLGEDGSRGEEADKQMEKALTFAALALQRLNTGDHKRRRDIKGLSGLNKFTRRISQF